MKVVILGKGEMLINLIEGVCDAGFEIAGVFRHERTWQSPFRLFLHDFFKTSPDVTLIKEKKLHEIKCKSANSDAFKREILKLNPDIILVGTWREKLRKEIIDLPKIATINVHPSLLPKYRGPNPYLQTILHGEKYSGITFHLMDENFDSGPILAQQKIEILPSYTSRELKNKTVFLARLITCELLKKLNAGIVTQIPQNEEDATYYPNITGDEMMLDFEKQTSVEIINTVLGYRSESFLLSDFTDIASKEHVFITSDDGTRGIKGNVLDAMERYGIQTDVIFACGPMPMLCAIKQYAEKNNIEAYISLEERMACGVGACLGCVCKTTKIDEHSKVYNSRICTDGPVYPAEDVDI